jgi:hypothetical protein
MRVWEDRMSKYLYIFLFVLCCSCNPKESQNPVNEEVNINAHEEVNIEQPVIIELDIPEIMVVNSPEGLRVRSDPGLSGEKLFTLPNKKQVSIIKIYKEKAIIDGIEGQWKYIDIDEGKGWVFGGYLLTSGEYFNKNRGNIIGKWFIYERNGEKPEPWLDGWNFNPDVRFYRTIDWDLCYQFNDDNTFYYGRLGSGFGHGGKWRFDGNKIEIYGDVYYEGMMEDDAGTFSYYITFTFIDESHALIENDGDFDKTAKQNTGVLDLITNNDLTGLERYFSNPEKREKELLNYYENKVTILMYALAYSKAEIASYLIDIGSDINAGNVYNVTPLHYACESYRAEDMFEIIKKMLEKGAAVNSFDDRGQTPLDYTLYDNRRNTDKIKDVRSLLKEYGGIYGNERRAEYAER